jgi:hypothetical protein
VNGGDSLIVFSNDHEFTDVETLDDDEEEYNITYCLRCCAVCFTWARSTATHGMAAKSQTKCTSGGVDSGADEFLSMHNKRITLQAPHDLYTRQKLNRKTNSGIVKCHLTLSIS